MLSHGVKNSFTECYQQRTCHSRGLESEIDILDSYKAKSEKKQHVF